jgi:hypothetical protein
MEPNVTTISIWCPQNLWDVIMGDSVSETFEKGDLGITSELPDIFSSVL